MPESAATNAASYTTQWDATHTSLELANDGVSNAPTRLKEGSDERKTHCGQRWAGDTFPQTAD